MAVVNGTDSDVGMGETEVTTGAPIHVLLVDDEASFRSATAQRLRLRGLRNDASSPPPTGM